MNPRLPLTVNQHRIYLAILRHWATHAVSPTMRDLMAATGIASTQGITCHLKPLRRKGWLVANDFGSSRSMIPTDLEATVKDWASSLLAEATAWPAVESRAA